MTLLDKIFPTSRTAPRLEERIENDRIYRAGVEQGKLESRSMFKDIWLPSRTNAGEVITEERSLTISAVYAAVMIIANTTATLPLKLYRRRSDGGKDDASDHPLYRVLHSESNPRMSAYKFRQAVMMHMLLWGNSYSEIETNNSGDVIALWPINPRRVELRRVGDSTEYKIWLPGGGFEIKNQEQILHISNLGFDGVEGKSPIALFREALGITLAAEKYGANFFKNDARPGIFLKHPLKLSPQAHEHLKRDFHEQQGGAGNAWKPQILEEGMDIGTVGLPPGDAQFIQTREFGVLEVARIFNVPPHMLADLSRATFSNIEHQSLAFVTRSLLDRLVNIEQEINRRLLTESEKNTFFAEHVVAGLLRGDIKSRYEAYAVGRNWGWLSADDIRKLENMNPLPNEQGQIYLQPLNMVPAGSDPDEMFRKEVRKEFRQTLPPRYRLARAMLPMLADILARANRREIAEIRKAVDRYLISGDTEGFRAFLEEFETEHARWLMERGRIIPLFEAFHEQMAEAASDEVGGEAEVDEEFTRDYAESYANRHAGSTRGQLEALLREENPREAVLERLDEWEEDDHRALKEAENERVRASNAFTKVSWARRGVNAIRWRTVGQNCPMCDSLDGLVVEIMRFFVNEGETLVNREGTDLISTSNIGHPPLHLGCDCLTMPEMGRKRLTAHEIRKVKQTCLQSPMVTRRNGVHA